MLPLQMFDINISAASCMYLPVAIQANSRAMYQYALKKYRPIHSLIE